MDLSKTISEEKKSKPSFWNRLLRLPRKSYLKEKQDDSFKRHSMIYSSLNTPKRQKEESSTSDESENFITLESSALQDVHRDAGILFLNKSSVENCFAPKEENKHVQFAPTPMNKYYRVDAKAAPAKKREENKENVEHSNSVKPTRPILRLNKKNKTSSQSSSAEETESNLGTKLLNVTYIDGPQVKTPSMPRTSTKITLVERKNGSVPHLNVSNIVKYNSLPRNPKIPEEKLNADASEPRALQQTCDVKSTQSLCSQPNKNIFQKSDLDCMYRRSMRDVSTHRQSCYGISNPSKIFEAKKVLQAQNYDANQDARRRLSLGPPLHFPQNDSGYHTTASNQKCSLTQVQGNFKFPGSYQDTTGSSDQQISRSKLKGVNIGRSNVAILNKQNYHASTGHIPNRAINEVGLPMASSKKGSEVTIKNRSKSPHYIPLCETFTTAKSVKNSISEKAIGKHAIQQQQQQQKNREFSAEGTSKSSYFGFPVQNKKQVCESSLEQPSIITESRKQAILSSMYSQKRKIINKICKYNSKQSDEGFSSMADDECSFNCSCPTCITKFSKAYKRNGLKQFFSGNKDKYFFTIEPEIKERNELCRLPENQTVEGPMAKAQPHLSNKNENELGHNKTWYDCNDTLCQTPCKRTGPENNKVEDTTKTSRNKIVENIYENITQIINSATKKNLTPKDVKKLLSTPISSPLKSQKKIQRTLFSDDDEKEKLDQTLKEILSPVQTSDCFNDSIVLLQEIFQKLSQECKELLQPNSTTDIPNQNSSTPISSDSPGGKYVNNLIKNLKSSELSPADFANIIGGIAQNIFSDTKAKKRNVRTLVHSASLPDLQNKRSFLKRAVSVANSLKDLCDIQIKARTGSGSAPNQNVMTNGDSAGIDSALSGDSASVSRQLPEGWSKTPTTENSTVSDDTPTKTCSGTDKDSSNCSEGELQLLENAIRLGMGLAPVEKVKKPSLYTASPTKATKYKSRDVLSGKGNFE